MENSLLRKAAGFMLEHRRHKRWQKVVSGMAAVVVFCTTYALILPAITMSNETICGLEEHAHTEACWTTEIRYPQSSMACVFETESEVAHEHDSLCYSEDGTLICELECLMLHSHTDSCFEEEKDLICTETEDFGHTHSDSCYTRTQGELTCTEAEDPGHTHSDSCYETSSELTCSDESEEHVHDESCYTETTTLICQEEERPGHSHSDSCYVWIEELTCTQEERPAGHIHDDSCYETYDVLVCELEEVILHTHDESCYDESGTLFCALPEVVAHQHTADCIIPAEGESWEEQVLTCTLEVHSHTEACYPKEEAVEVICGCEEHVHSEDCYDTDGNLICTLEEHSHTEACYGQEETQEEVQEEAQEESAETICGYEEHTHSEGCYDADGNVICTLEEHIHSEACYAAEDQESVQEVISLIDAMPSADEIDAVMMDYENMGDLSGQDAYFLEVSQEVISVYEQYSQLSEEQQALVTNADKLLALEYIWEQQEEAATYTAEISGYNMEANNIIPIDGYLGWQAAYFNGSLQPYSGENDGENDYPGLTKEMLGTNGCNVIYIDLPVVNGNWHNLSSYFLNKTAVNGTKQGVFNVDLYNDWCAVSVETCDTYPFYYVRQLVNHDSSDKARIGRMTTTTTDGFLLLIRRSYIEKNNLYIPTGNVTDFAYVHLNKEDLTEQTGRGKYEDDSGWLPSSLSARSTYGYVTLSPMDTVPDASARNDDMHVVDDIKFKLFDYSNYINKTSINDSDSTTVGNIDSSYRALAKYFYFRGGFEDGRDYSLDVAKYTPNVNTVSQDGAGHKLYDQDGYTVNHARVEPNLWNGYPILDFTVDANGNAISPPSGWGTGEKLNARSLRFLFDENYAETYGWTDIHKIAPGAVTEYSPTNTILQFNENTHTYWYDSAKHAVDYDIDEQEFRVRKYTERTSITADWPFDDSAGSGDFLPFNYSNGIVNATYHSGSQPGVKPVADSSFRMNDVNYWFGMSMEFDFIQGENGTVTYTNSKGETKTDVMEFEFSGDDDVWVFVDGVRILDLGGTHGSVTGTINFQTGEVTQKLTWGEDPNKSFPTTLKNCFELAGQTPNGGWDTDSSERFADYSTHTLQFYYLERGTAVANCSIRFNLPNFQNPLVVGKTLEAADGNVSADVLEYLQDNTEYSYRVVKATADGTPTAELLIKGGQVYTVLDNGLNIGTYEVGADGFFKLKHGQQAIFENIWEIAGEAPVDFVVEEMLPDSQTGHYNSVSYTLSAEEGTITDKTDSSVERFVGYYSPKLTSAKSTQIQFRNVVDTETLGKLAITKAIADYVPPAARGVAETFKMYVTLDGIPLPVETTYDVDGQTRTVTETGYIEIAHGETAVISNLLAGTVFEVREDSDSATGYTVAYSGDEGTSTDGSSISGEIQMDATVSVLVTNSEQGTVIPIPIHKTLLNPDSAQRTFTFRVEQVNADGGYTVIDPEFEITLEPGEEQSGGNFVLTYIDPEIDTFPATYTYRITENTGEPGVVYDDAVYLVTVEVSQGTDGLMAEITSVAKDGVEVTDKTITFRNEVVRYTLPETGGGGTGPYAAAGLLTMLGAAYLLYKELMRRREDYTATS